MQKTWISRKIQNIETDWVLRSFGACLSLVHIWTFLYWMQHGFFVLSQSAINSEPICFPFFPQCDLFRQSLSSQSWSFLLYLYGFLGVTSFLLYLNKKTITVAWWTLLVVSFFKLLLHLSNYNFMGNYHYMGHIITFAYLLLPNPSLVSRYLIVAFYVAAGALKFNSDWLSGAAMIRAPWLYGTPLTIALFYVLILEIVFSLCLLSQRRWIRWLCLAQFILFHLFSWHVVGFFYPLVMFSLLSIFFLEEYQNRRRLEPSPNHWQLLMRGAEPKVVYFVLLIFTVMQILPLLLSHQPSLSGVSRLASLNMFDARTECQSILIAETNRGSIHLTEPLKNLGVRLRCDPLVFLNQALQICRQKEKDSDFKSLHLALFSKRVTSLDYQKVLDLKNVCTIKNPLWAELTKAESQ